MDVQVAVLVRGTRQSLSWIDGRVEGDREALHRLEAVTQRSAFPDLLEFLHAVEDAFGERPRFRTHDERARVEPAADDLSSASRGR
ncbi:MAG TPA: hypothetical protein VJM33_02555 [Microthrixaceae bacterium]|nr:hypothetical protein [Microthrixaceae bacterium]